MAGATSFFPGKCHLFRLRWSWIHLLSRAVGVVNVRFCLVRIFWSTPQVPMQEESALLSITLSGALIACRSQTIHLGCNYVEELKTDFCHRSGAVALHHMRRWHAAVEVAVDSRGPRCVLASVGMRACLLEGNWSRVIGRWMYGCMFLNTDLHDLSL